MKGNPKRANSLAYVFLGMLIVWIIVRFLRRERGLDTFDNSDKTNTKAPHIYYINLDKATERNRRFTSRLQSTGLNATRVRGVTPVDLSRFTIKMPRQCSTNTQLEISCSISHLKAIHTAYHNTSNPDDLGLIMEDDIMFLRVPDWQELVRSAPADWDILQLYIINPAFIDIVYNRPNYGVNKDWMRHEYEMTSCGAYLMSKRSMERLLRVFVPEYKNPNWEAITQIDFTHVPSNCIADYFIYLYMKTYVYKKILVNEEGEDSYIHPDHLIGHKHAINRVNQLFLQQSQQ